MPIRNKECPGVGACYRWTDIGYVKHVNFETCPCTLYGCPMCSTLHPELTFRWNNGLCKDCDLKRALDFAHDVALAPDSAPLLPRPPYQ